MSDSKLGGAGSIFELYRMFVISWCDDGFRIILRQSTIA